MKRTPLQRKTPIRRTRMRRRHKSTRYSRRERDLDYLRWIKTLLCAVEEEWPLGVPPTPCADVIEADHDSRGRGLSQKSPDTSAIGLCTQHHKERSDHTGTFKHATRDQVRAWFARAQARCQTQWRELHGETVA